MGFLEDVSIWEVWLATTVILFAFSSPMESLNAGFRWWIVGLLMWAVVALPMAAILWFFIWAAWQA